MIGGNLLAKLYAFCKILQKKSIKWDLISIIMALQTGGI